MTPAATTLSERVREIIANDVGVCWFQETHDDEFCIPIGKQLLAYIEAAQAMRAEFPIVMGGTAFDAAEAELLAALQVKV